MTELGLSSLVGFVDSYSLRLAELKETLNTLDNRIGDGDHGTNMARGFAAANQQLQKNPPADLGAACSAVAMALLGHVGGASGPLYGTVFLKMGNVLGHEPHADEATLVQAIAAARQGIAERGKATYGDKTMLDVWEKSVTYLQGNPATDRFLGVATVALDEALATRDRIAKKGRAAYLGPRSQGVCDPGSVSSGLFFEEFARACGKELELIPWDTLVL
ncbi:dihydroxyacetone kinase subunit DhaL [Alicyclobacillus sp. ALC3]|uniref:dihydroxyacetone kinase subunit DhaL n=1 Tax=Alicyclobacillus sp. ALC3 TaxID=2796143 RepID=UPI0023793F63|nr:dihydroxyacetone kinase subunit DhaL [Alicyclobacillus sp. ALC3]WDL98184.1 dihydroxyacetone kinase subunit L [Alicyclobacillus sp. ALC3]